MIAVTLALVALQAVPADDLSLEGERLGRLSTLFAVCEAYYTVDLRAGQRVATDFEQRSTEAGWTADQRANAYDRGRALERAEIGIVMDASAMTPQEARRGVRQMFPRLKTRCQDLAREVPGSISDVAEGNRRLDAAARRFR